MHNTPAAEEGGLPPPTYENLADYARVESGTIGEEWLNANKEASREEARKYTEECAAKVSWIKTAVKNRVGSFAGSLKNLYFLLVLNGKMQVFFRWRMSWALLESGQRLAGLIRQPPNHRKRKRNPALAAAAQMEQWKNFGKETVQALTVDGIQGEFAKDEEKVFRRSGWRRAVRCGGMVGAASSPLYFF